MIARKVTGCGNVIVVFEWRHPERSRFSGGARDLAGSAAIKPFFLGRALAAEGPALSRFTI